MLFSMALGTERHTVAHIKTQRRVVRPLFDMMRVQLAACPTLAASVAIALIHGRAPLDVFRHVALGAASAPNLAVSPDDFNAVINEERLAFLQVRQLAIQTARKLPDSLGAYRCFVINLYTLTLLFIDAVQGFYLYALLLE